MPSPSDASRTSRTLSDSSSTSQLHSRGHSTTESLRALELELGPRDAAGGTELHRTNSFMSMAGFEFEHALLPLSLTEGEVEHEEHEKHVGLLQGMALVVGMQVGSGIFSSPGVVVGNVGSVGASLVVWVISGLLAWTGASSFAELGCAIPLSGGAQAYLAYSFGPMASYLYTWSAVTVLKPGSSAIIALIFGEYVNRMIFHAFTGDTEAKVPEWTFRITALLAVVLVSALNVISAKSGAHSAVVFTTIKIGSLIFVAILGVLYYARHGPGGLSGNIFAGSSKNPSSYAIALYSGLWAFDGWDQCSFVAGEMKDPSRDLPRALHSSMTIVLILFLSANVSYFIVLDPATVASSNTVALDFGSVTIGRLGAVVFSTLVAISCFGALNNGVYTTSRLIYAASRDHFIPEFFARYHPRRKTPDNAIMLNAGLTALFVLFGGGFRKLLNFFSVTSWTLYLVTIVGMLYLRVKEPHLDRPYKAWISTPIVFCAVALFLLIMPIVAAPWEALAAFLFMAAGVPMYYLTARSRIAAKGYTRMDGGGAPDGILGALSGAWFALVDDIANHLPTRWAERIRGRQEAPLEERRGMLEQVEMSEI